MSIESFYANIKIENVNKEDLNKIFNDNKTFQLAMAYHWDDVDKELSIKATLVNQTFFQAKYAGLHTR